MTPAESFLVALEFTLNECVGEGAVMVIDRQKSRVSLSQDGQILTVPQIVIVYRGSVGNLNALYKGVGLAMEWFKTILWANDEHSLFVVGRGRPLRFERGKRRRIILRTDEPLPLCWERGSPRGFHDEGFEAVLDLLARRNRM